MRQVEIIKQINKYTNNNKLYNIYYIYIYIYI